MARAQKRDTEADLLADRLEQWGLKHKLEGDTYVAGLLSALRERENLPLWAEINPLDYLPRPDATADKKVSNLARRLGVIRGVLLFSPVALTWLAVGEASRGFSEYIEENPNAVVNFLEFWQNGYGYIPQSATLTRIAFLDFLIIMGVIILTVVVAGMTRRAQAIRMDQIAEQETERFELGLMISHYLFDKRAITPITMKDSLAKSIQSLANSTKSLNDSAKALQKLTKSLPNNSEILREVKKLKPSFSFDWDK
ncbi:MAG: hypothetical protein ACO375_04385 [Candidatus Nanopelagicaceae bacterium]